MSAKWGIAKGLKFASDQDGINSFPPWDSNTNAVVAREMKVLSIIHLGNRLLLDVFGMMSCCVEASKGFLRYYSIPHRVRNSEEQSWIAKLCQYAGAFNCFFILANSCFANSFAPFEKQFLFIFFFFVGGGVIHNWRPCHFQKSCTCNLQLINQIRPFTQLDTSATGFESSLPS